MKRKVLIYSLHLGAGGTEKSLVNLLNNLDYSKYEVDLLLQEKKGVPSNFQQLPKEVKLLYICHPVFLYKNGQGWILSTLRKLEHFFCKVLYKIYRNSNYLLYKVKLKNKKYDIEISFFHTLVRYLVGSPLKSKKIAWVHMDLKYQMTFSPSKRFYKRLHMLKKMDKIIAVSHRAKDGLLTVLSGIEEKIHVIYNGINVNEVVQKSQENIPEKKTNSLQLVAVGRLCHAKGFERLIKVCRQLKQEGLDFHLWILGEGENYNQLAFRG